jgi:hypothetical protein
MCSSGTPIGVFDTLKWEFIDAPLLQTRLTKKEIEEQNIVGLHELCHENSFDPYGYYDGEIWCEYGSFYIAFLHKKDLDTLKYLIVYHPVVIEGSSCFVQYLDSDII